jgi:AraC family transcriptional regulator
LAKVAVGLKSAHAERRKHAAPDRATRRLIATEDDWSVTDLMCTLGPLDRPFEERHGRYTVAIVLAGTFQYRCPLGSAVMTPGSLLLGNPGLCFECGHEHGQGDRCVSFTYAADYFERLGADAGACGCLAGFKVPRLPPLRACSSLVARVAAGAMHSASVSWAELAAIVAVRAMEVAAGTSASRAQLPLNAEARVTRIVRTIDSEPHRGLLLENLSRESGLSPFYFLRTFQRVTGITPHQYVLRSRLREAAARLVTGSGKVIDIALDCGFGDVSNFNRAFRTEFGVSPRKYRRPVGS